MAKGGSKGGSFGPTVSRPDGSDHSSQRDDNSSIFIMITMASIAGLVIIQ